MTDYQAVSKEYTRLGFTYPKPEDFTAEEVAERVAALPESYLTTDMATLKGKSLPASVVRLFGELAAAFGLEVSAGYQQLEIRRPTTQAEREESALSLLRGDRDAEQRKTAERSLASASGSEAAP